MRISNYLPLFLTMMSPAASRDEMMQITLPQILPVENNVRGAVTALTASNVASQHNSEINKLADEVVEIAKKSQNWANRLSVTDLKQFPLVKKYHLEKRIISRFEAP